MRDEERLDERGEKVQKSISQDTNNVGSMRVIVYRTDQVGGVQQKNNVNNGVTAKAVSIRKIV